jgi:hypothetical protein
MFFAVLRVLLVFVLWWALLWFVLPVDWSREGPLSLVFQHVAPPLLVMVMWWLFKRLRVWYALRAEQIAAQRMAAEDEGQQKAAQAAHREGLLARRAHVECRGVWMALSRPPDWMRKGAFPFIREDAERIRESERVDALAASLERVLGAAFRQCEALAWLPVRLAHDGYDGLEAADRVVGVWRRAVEASGMTHLPPLDCQVLPGTGNLVERAIDLFRDAPALPAVLVLGMDSPLADAPRDFGAGHAVLALLLCRPGLDALETGQPDSGMQEADPYTPFWERASDPVAEVIQWGNIPPALRRDFLSCCPPIATLHKPAGLAEPDSWQARAVVRQIRDLVCESFVQAGLRDAPFGEAASAPEEAANPDIAWLVHDSPDAHRFAALSSAMLDCGCELDSIAEASNARNACGNVGAAREALMLAVASIRAMQLGKPVLLAGFGKEGGMHVGVARPHDPDSIFLASLQAFA